MLLFAVVIFSVNHTFLIQLNPQHTVPILVDPDEDFTIWDSHAIAIYLVGQYGSDDSLYPRNNVKKCAIINQRLQFDNLLFDRCKAAFVSVYKCNNSNLIGVTQNLHIQSHRRFGF